MKQINISGVIGWDAMPDDLRQALKAANGEDVEILISSPGGYVSDGIEMFNLIRNYAGHTTARLTGYAMSMASYIPLAAKKIIAEDNAVYMIHNARGGVFGDHNDILKYGETTKAISNLLARAYVKRTGKSLKTVQEMMDSETYFFGQDMIDHGFIDEIVSSGEENDRDSAVAFAHASHQACLAKITADQSALKKDLTRAAAIFTATTGNHPAKRKDVIMTREQLLSDHPELVEALRAEALAGMIPTADLSAQLAAAEEKGAANERARIQAVEAQLIPGHESLIAGFKFDGKTTGEQAAVAVIAADKGIRAAALSAMESGANPAVPAVDPPEGDSSATLPVEEQAKAAWDKDAALRAEFGNKFEAYLAYEQNAATGRARVFGKK